MRRKRLTMAQRRKLLIVLEYIVFMLKRDLA